VNLMSNPIKRTETNFRSKPRPDARNHTARLQDPDDRCETGRTAPCRSSRALFPRGAGGWPPAGGTVAPKAAACHCCCRGRARWPVSAQQHRRAQRRATPQQRSSSSSPAPLKNPPAPKGKRKQPIQSTPHCLSHPHLTSSPPPLSSASLHKFTALFAWTSAAAHETGAS